MGFIDDVEERGSEGTKAREGGRAGKRTGGSDSSHFVRRSESKSKFNV